MVMHFDIEPRTIYLARHGSHAYGTSLPKTPNLALLNTRCCDIQERFWKENG